MGKNIVFSFSFFFFFFFVVVFYFVIVREVLENNSFLDSETCSKMLYNLTARVAY